VSHADCSLGECDLVVLWVLQVLVGCSAEAEHRVGIIRAIIVSQPTAMTTHPGLHKLQAAVVPPPRCSTYALNSDFDSWRWYGVGLPLSAGKLMKALRTSTTSMGTQSLQNSQQNINSQRFPRSAVPVVLGLSRRSKLRGLITAPKLSLKHLLAAQPAGMLLGRLIRAVELPKPLMMENRPHHPPQASDSSQALGQSQRNCPPIGCVVGC
jgi:hypothetical protein